MKRHIGIHYVNHPKHLSITLALIISGIFSVAYSIQAYPEIFKTEITLEKESDIGPSEPVVINFSLAMPKGAYGSEIYVEPKEDIKLRWEDSNKRLVIVPDKFWKPETDYKIHFPESKNVFFSKTSEKNINFATIKYPEVKSFFPEDGAKDVLVDIEDPIIINFDKPTEGFFIKFVLDPYSDMLFQNNPRKTEFKLLPKDRVEDGVKYNLKIYAKYAYDTSDNYKEISNSFFETKPMPPVAWEKDFTLRLAQAKKYTKAKIESGKYIDINLSAQILSTFENGKLLASYLISTGKRGMDTPKGTFNILEKRQRPWSKKYALYMPWFMLFTRQGHGIHELPEWPGGYKEGANHLGIPVSHGCVRLGIGPAATAYDWAEVGTPIVVY